MKSSCSENKKSQSCSNLQKFDNIDVFYYGAIQNDHLYAYNYDYIDAVNAQRQVKFMFLVKITFPIK